MRLVARGFEQTGSSETGFLRWNAKAHDFARTSHDCGNSRKSSCFRRLSQCISSITDANRVRDGVCGTSTRSTWTLPRYGFSRSSRQPLNTSHFLVFARTCNNLSHDIGSSVCARHLIHVSCACVFVLSSTSTSHSSFVSPIFYFILLIFYFLFHVDRFGARSPVLFAERGVWPFGQQRPSHRL